MNQFQRGNVQRQSFKPLLDDALQVLKGQFYNPESDKFKAITYTIKNCEFFRNSFSSSIKLNEFAQVARFYVNYEALDYGSVVQREKEYVDKISIILDGEVEKIRQRPYGEIEQEVQKERKWKSLLEDEAFGKAMEIRKMQETDEVIRPEKPAFMTCIARIPAPEEAPQEKKLKGSVLLRHLKTEKFESSPKQQVSTVISSDDEETPKAFAVKVLKKTTTTALSPSTKEEDVCSLYDIGFQGGQNGEAKSLDSLKITKEDEQLLKTTALFDSEVKRMYFVENVLRAIKVKSFHAGEYFGESFCRATPLKSDSMFIVSSKQAHLLTLSKEDFERIKNDLEKQDSEKVKMLMKIFPSFSKKNVKEFAQFFCQKSFAKDEVIYSQGDLSQHCYLVNTGEIKLFKDIQGRTSPNSFSSNSSRTLFDVPVVSVIKNQFFGEERLLDKEERKYTAVAHSPNAVVLILDANFFELIKLKFGSFFEVLKSQAIEKFYWREQRASELYETQNFFAKPRLSCQIKSPTKPAKITISKWADIPSPVKLRPTGLSTPRGDLSEDFVSEADRARLEGHSSPHQFQRLKAYKSKYSRKTMVVTHNVSNSNENLSKSIQASHVDFSPVKDLVGFNLRKELYEAKSPSNLGQARRPKGKTQVELPVITSSIRAMLKLNNGGIPKVEREEKKMVVIETEKVKKSMVVSQVSPKLVKRHGISTRVVSLSEGIFNSTIQGQSLRRIKG